MTTNTTVAQSTPVMMTCADLIHQEDRFIQEYGDYFNLPPHLNRSAILEQICSSHPGPGPMIPVLPHFMFERANDNRIRLTGRVSPPVVGSSIQAAPLLPLYRRLGRAPRIHRFMDTPTRLPTPPREVPSPLPAPKATESPAPEPAPRSIIPDEWYPTTRLATPSDTYSSRPASPDFGTPDLSEHSGAPAPRPKMEFVYPPRPRPLRNPRDGEDGMERGHSPGGTWLDKMLVDLEQGRREVNGDLQELRTEVKEAVFEVAKLQILRDEEAKAMKAFLESLRSIVGPELVQTIIEDAMQAAGDKTSDEDNGSDDDDEDGGGSGDDDEDEDNDDDDDDDAKNNHCSPSQQGSDDAPIRHFDGIPTGPALWDFVPAPFPSTNSRWKPTIHGGSLWDVEPSTTKRSRDDDNESDSGASGSGGSDTSGSRRKRAKLDSRRTPSPAYSDGPATSSPSQKPQRDVKSRQGSELEVEDSIRMSGLESNNSSFSFKQPRSESPFELSSPHRQEPQSRYSTSSSGSSESDSDGDLWVTWNDYEAAQDDDEDDESFATPDEESSEDDLEFDVANDEVVESRYFILDKHGHGTGRWSPNPPPLTLSPSSDSDNSWVPRFEYDSSDLPTAGPSQPSAAPNAEPSHPRTRPLTRARSRLRTTSSGGLEAANFDEGPAYEARLAHEAEVFAAWRRHNVAVGEYGYEGVFAAIRADGEGGVAVLFETGESDGEHEAEGGTGKGKGKGKA